MRKLFLTVAALAAFACPAFAQVTLAVPRAGQITTVTTGGTAVNAIDATPLNGCTITNPLTLGDQGIAAAEPLLVNPVTTATAAANITTVSIPPGSSYSCIPNSNGPVSVNAVTTGHKFTVVRW